MAGDAKINLQCFQTPHAQDGHTLSPNVSSLVSCMLKRNVTEESSYIHKYMPKQTEDVDGTRHASTTYAAKL